eukprot:CAMPEP_0198154736 /NCGR_PEP_ID=MMETSP1443-20131203/68763_1 /TAXON_ID=186043 /ORGANISM="Entomoneis sp., Strain CCMP2396" /LENGTH=376 /DNA_ID=CAMNT_0043821441 /DNA_START=109 /DNA_END=1240 /DNA_ORIENTATION=-
MIEVLLAFSSQNIGLSDVSSMGDTSLDEEELFGGTNEEEDLDTKNAKTSVNLVFVADEHEVTRKTLTPADKYGSIFESSNPMLEGEGAFASPMFAPRERQQQQQQQDQKLSGEELYLRQASDDSESVDGDDEDDNYNDVDSLDIAHAKHMKCQFISKRGNEENGILLMIPAGSIFESSNPMLGGEGTFAGPMFAPRERQHHQQQQKQQKLRREELHLTQASDDSESVDGDDEDYNYNDVEDDTYSWIERMGTVDSLDIHHAKNMKCQFISKRAKRKKRYTTNDTSSSNNIIPLVRERTSTKDSLDFCKMSLSEEESQSRRAAGGNGGGGGHHSSGDESARSGSGGNNNNKKLRSRRSRTRRGCKKAQRMVSLQHIE